MAELRSQKVVDKAKERLQLVREGKSKIVCRSIWLLITRKCPLECRHCYFCGSRDGKSLTLPQVERIIQHLPAGIESLGISGGEPFTNRKLLYETLKLIKKRNFPSLTNINVQTVGFWAKSKVHAKKVIGELIDLGVNSFLIYGHDKWHWERGLQKERQEMLVDVLINEFDAYKPKGMQAQVRALFRPDDRITYSLNETRLVRPVGRAAWATTPKEQSPPSTNPICRWNDFLHLSPKGYIYTINFNGEVHYCIYQIAKPLGNIIERPLIDILKNARRNKFFQIANKGLNIANLAVEYFGMSEQEAIRSIELKGRCVFHWEILTQYFKNRKDAPIMYDVFKLERERYKKV